MANNKEEVNPIVDKRLYKIDKAAGDLVEDITITQIREQGVDLFKYVDENDLDMEVIPVKLTTHVNSAKYFYGKIAGDNYNILGNQFQYTLKPKMNIEEIIGDVVEARNKATSTQSKTQTATSFISIMKIWFYIVSDRLRQMDFTAEEVKKSSDLKNTSLSAVIDYANEQLILMDRKPKFMLKTSIIKVDTGDEETSYSICVLTNDDVKQTNIVIEKKTSTKALEVIIERFWRNNIQSFLTIINTVLQPIGDKEIDKQIEKFNNMDKNKLFKIVNKSYEFKNNHFLKVGVRISESGLDKIKTATVKWEDMFKRSLLYCLVFKLKKKMKQKAAEDYLTDKVFKKAIKVFNLGKEARERNQDKTKKEELRQKIKDDYGDLEWVDDYLTSSGLVFENSICGKNNTIANKIFGVVDKSFFEQSDEYLDRVWKSCGGDGSSGSSQACFDLIDLKRRIIVECKDYNIDLVRAHNVNIQAKLRYLMECKAKLNKACILKVKADIVNYLTILSNTIEFDRGFYNECDYIGFGMTINKFQPIKDKIEEIKRTKDTSYTQVNTIERWEEVARHQDNQRYFPVINNSREVVRIVKKKNKGESDAVNQSVNEMLHEDMGNHRYEYLFIISVDVGENRTRATAIYDYTQDDVLRNPFPLSTYKAIQNDKGFFQMVKIPIDKFKPRVVEVE